MYSNTRDSLFWWWWSAGCWLAAVVFVALLLLLLLLILSFFSFSNFGSLRLLLESVGTTHTHGRLLLLLLVVAAIITTQKTRDGTTVTTIWLQLNSTFGLLLSLLTCSINGQ